MSPITNLSMGDCIITWHCVIVAGEEIFLVYVTECKRTQYAPQDLR